MADKKTPSPNDKNTVNLAVGMKADDREKIAKEVCGFYVTDKEGRRDWEDKRNRWYKLWLMKRDAKDEPWPDASNVCVPLLAIACNQFHGRAYQAFFNPPNVVKTIPVMPNDVTRAKHVEAFMNWQVMYEMPDFEEDHDKLLLNLPVNGHAFKKSYYDAENERPVSEYVSAMEIYLPYRTKKLETARRIIHAMWKHYDEMAKKNRKKNYFVDFDKVTTAQGTEPEHELESTKDEVETETTESTEKPKLFLECHYEIKLPGTDNYANVIATVDYDSQTLLRLTNRDMTIDSKKYTANYFTGYGFIPNPEGYYHLGFGHFLEHLNEMANTAFNQIFDSGRLTNQPFGFYGRRLGIKKKEIKLHPGLMTEVEDATQVFFPNMQRVDQTLFQVLALVQQYTEGFTSTSDYLLGREAKGVKTPTATGTLAIIEQGLIQYTVLTKRLFRAFKRELQNLYGIDSLFLPESKQYRIMGSEEAIAFPTIKRSDFDGKLDVIPVGDPSYASKLTRRQEAAEIYSGVLQNPLVVQNPKIQVINPTAVYEATKAWLDTFDRYDTAKMLPQLPDPSMPPEVENGMFMQGDMVDPKPGEPHLLHLQIHSNFKNTDFYKAMREDYKPLLNKHLEKTNALIYQEQQQMQNLGAGSPNGQQPMPQPAPAMTPQGAEEETPEEAQPPEGAGGMDGV